MMAERRGTAMTKKKRQFGGWKTREAQQAYMKRYQQRNRARLTEWARSHRAKHRQKYAAQARARRALTKDRINDNRVDSRKIGGLITPAQYDEMLLKQDGVCAICRTATVLKPAPGHKRRRQLCVDHDHATGKVRGLLCFVCNAGLGFFRDDPIRLRAAAIYLHDHKG